MGRRISFIGTGAMGGAVLERLIEAKFVDADAVFACDIDQAKLTETKQKFDVRTSTDNSDAARFGDAIVLAVPPKEARQVLEEIRDSLLESKILISLVALIPIGLIEETLRLRIGAVRVMPNMPSMVGSGFNVFSFGRYLSSEDKEWVRSLLGVLGEYKEVGEEKIEIYSILSAMGPTYFLPFVDTLIEFGKNNGLSYEEARKAGASTLEGTGELVSRVDRSIESLKNMIGTQPLKTREEQIRSIMKEELNRTLQQLKVAKEKLTK